MKLLILGLLLTPIAFSQAIKVNLNGDYLFSKEDLSISEIIKDYAKIKKLNLIMQVKPIGEFTLLGPRLVKKEEIDLFVTAAISEAGYSMVSDHSLNQIQIMMTRDIRYGGANLYKSVTDLPNTYEHTMLSLKLKHAKTRDMTRNLRPFVSRYGRIITDKNTNMIIISDRAKNVRRLQRLVNSIDTPRFYERVKFLEKLNQDVKLTVEKNISTLDFVKDQHVLFITMFSFIAGILGFGIRGYLMKRIEGGW